MTTQVMTTCDGQIQLNGWCNKCGQPAQTTGMVCGRLIPVQNISNIKLGEWQVNNPDFISASPNPYTARVLSNDEWSFITSALNAYWNQAHYDLTERGHRGELGDIERDQLEKQKVKSKALMDKIGY